MTSHATARELPGWLKIALGTTVLLGGMLIVMGVQRGPATCEAIEAPRTLRLDRAVDREHLTADAASATRKARRYMAGGTSADERLQRFLECDALLVRGIASAHGVSVDQVRASAAQPDTLNP
jgi:hypothetical protein